MNLYLIDKQTSNVPRLVEIEVIKEEPSRYVVLPCLTTSFCGRIPKDTACLTPLAAWEQYLARRVVEMEALKIQVNAINSSVVRARNEIEKLKGAP